MPRVVMFGRRWHFSTDIVPVPVTVVALYHLVMVLVLFILPFGRDYLPVTCSDPIGRQHIAVLATYMGLYSFSLLVEILLLLASCRGAPFETRKRRFVVPLLYLSLLPMVLHVPICIYSTPLVNLRSTCWPEDQRVGMRSLMRGVVFSCWGLIGLFTIWVISFLSVFEAPVREDEEQKRTVWRKRIRCIAACCCCGGNLAAVRVGDDLSEEDDTSSDEDEEVRPKGAAATGAAATSPPAAVAISRRGGDEADADDRGGTGDAENGKGGHGHRHHRRRHRYKRDQVGDLRDSAAPPTVEPLTSIAELTTGLLAHVDFDPSDLACAIVLASAEQTRRRALQTTLNLLPVLQAITGPEHTFQNLLGQAEAEGSGPALGGLRAGALPAVREATDEHETAAATAAASLAVPSHPQEGRLSAAEAAAAGVLAQAATAIPGSHRGSAADAVALLGFKGSALPESPSAVAALLEPSGSAETTRGRDQSASPPAAAGANPRAAGLSGSDATSRGDAGGVGSGRTTSAEAGGSASGRTTSGDATDALDSVQSLKLSSSARKAVTGEDAAPGSPTSAERAALGAEVPRLSSARASQLSMLEPGLMTPAASRAISERGLSSSATPSLGADSAHPERGSGTLGPKTSSRRLFGATGFRAARRARAASQDEASTLADVVGKLEGAVENWQDPTRADRGVLSLRAAGVQAKDLDPSSGVIWVRKSAAASSGRRERRSSSHRTSSARRNASPNDDGSGSRSGATRPTSRSTEARDSTADESIARAESSESFATCESESNASFSRHASRDVGRADSRGADAAEGAGLLPPRGSRAAGAALPPFSRLSNSGGRGDLASATPSGRSSPTGSRAPSRASAAGGRLPGGAPEPHHGLRARLSGVADRLHLRESAPKPEDLARDTTGAVSAGLVVSEDELDDPETGRAAPNPTDDDISAFLHRISHANVTPAGSVNDDAGAGGPEGRVRASAGQPGGGAASDAAGSAGAPSVADGDAPSQPATAASSELGRTSNASTAPPGGDSDIGVSRAPVLTPTWATAELAGGALSPEAVAALSADSATMARVKELDDVSYFLKYANAAYYLVPEPDQTRPLLDRIPMCRPTAATEGVIRGLEEIDPEDGFSRKSIELLHLNASNSVLAHVPYLIALDHNRRCVVIAVRGTISAADVVTDVVVKPERVYGLPNRVRDAMGDVPPFAHAGMVASARALYRDIAARGLLGELPRWPLGEEDERAELERGHAIGVEALGERPSSGGERGVSGVARSGAGARRAVARADEKAQSREVGPDAAAIGRSEASSGRRGSSDRVFGADARADGSVGGADARSVGSTDRAVARSDGSVGGADERSAGQPVAESTGASSDVLRGDDVGLIPPPPPFAIDEDDAEWEGSGRADEDEEAAGEGEPEAEPGEPRAGGAAPDGDASVPIGSRQAQETTPVGVRARSVRELILRRGWRLVVVGHSLGAGVASLLTARLLSTFPDVRCLAYCCPGATTSVELGAALADVVTSIAVGKDVVPRASVPNLGRLVDELVVALAMCRVHKLHVLLVPGYARGAAALRDRAKVFYDFGELPDEAREALRRYLRARARDGRALTTVPPGRLLFMRPLKRGRERRGWTGVWVEPRSLIDEGILLSSRGVSDHGVLNLRDALVDARKRSERLEAGGGGSSHKAFLGMSMDAWEALGVPAVAVKRARRVARWGVRMSGGNALAKGARYALNGFGTFVINGEVSSRASSSDQEERDRGLEDARVSSARSPSSIPATSHGGRLDAVAPSSSARGVEPVASSGGSTRAASLEPSSADGALHDRSHLHLAAREPAGAAGVPRDRSHPNLVSREDSFQSGFSAASSRPRVPGTDAHADGSLGPHATDASTASESAFGRNAGPRASEWGFSGEGAPEVKHKRRGLARRQARFVRRTLLGPATYTFKGIPALERSVSDIVAE